MGKDAFGNDVSELKTEEELAEEAAKEAEAELLDEEGAKLHAELEESLDMPISDMPLNHRHWTIANKLRMHLAKKG